MKLLPRVLVFSVGLLLVLAIGRQVYVELHKANPNEVEVLDRSVAQVPAGEFLMGSDTERPDERPRHLVHLDAFEIDRYEVTNARYRLFLQATDRLAPRYWLGGNYPSGQADYPVVGVSWEDADAYCTWAGARLPTEAEWEKACRGADGRIYPWGDTWDPSRANVDISLHQPHSDQAELVSWEEAWSLLPLVGKSSEVPRLQPVGSYLQGAGPYGVMDLVGNASEWIADWYNWGDYSNLPNRNPIVSAPPWNHCLRGSAWYDFYGAKGWARDQSRCSARNSAHEIQDPRVGFRCARSLSSTPANP